MSGITDSPDQPVTGGSAVALTALPCGPTGNILVTAHPLNTNVIRVGSASVSATRGQPLAAGASYTFFTTNASLLSAIVESGTGVLCTSAV